MEFSYVVYYAILNFFFYICLLHKHSISSTGMIVMVYYLMISIFAIPAYNMLPHDNYFCIFNFSEIKVWPYVLYFILTIILIKPIFNYDNLIENSNIVLPAQKTRIFIYFFIICSLASIIIFGRTLVNNSIIENLDEVRQNLYNDIQIIAYNNQVEHVVLLFTIYFSLPAKILFFYILANDRKGLDLSISLIILLGLGILLPDIMDAARTASRGMIINVFFELILCYTLFSSRIPPKTKAVLYTSFILSVLLMAVYSLMVTDARFGKNDNEDSISSLICYWGQPTLVFNSQVSQIEQFAWGARFFYPIFELFGVQPSFILENISQGWGVCFTTLVGDIWQDIGIFTIFVIPLIAFCFNRWISNKSSYGLAEVYVMIYYATTIQRGALVTKYGMCVNIFVTIFMYVLLKYIFSLKTES